MEKRDLFLFTSEFPYGNGEVFISNEIGFLCKKFGNVYIIPSNPGTSYSWTLPPNARVVPISKSNKSRIAKIWLMLTNLLLVRYILKHENRHSRQKNLALKHKKQNLALLLSLLTKLEKLKPLIKKNNTCYYSYWFSNDATILSILKRQGRINTYVSRAHGFDLYENNGKENYIPFRTFQLEMVDRVYCVSNIGMNYLKDIYPVYSDKIKSSYLGVGDHGENPYDSERLVIVSCSNIVTVKRLHLIVEALKEVHVEALWIHIGDGDLRLEIERMSGLLPENIKVEIRGRMSNSDLMTFFRQQSVSVFVNSSISEGIPVSIMEAISFGIPVIATNVGGVSEIVTSQTGILLNPDQVVSQLSGLLNSFLTSDLNQEHFRKQTKSFFTEKFSASQNYNTFSEDIIAVAS